LSVAKRSDAIHREILATSRVASLHFASVILAYHFIFSAYGFWLPNDPRGSWSDTIRQYEIQYELLKFGPATKVTTHRSLAHDPHDRELRRRAKQALLYKPVRFNGLQAREIARGFSIAAHESSYIIRALGILPDHAHLIVMRHSEHIDQLASHLKSKATMQLNSEKMHPFASHPRVDGTLPSPWSRSHWCHDDRHLQTAIRYVEQNPIKSGLPRQRWNIVTDSISVDHA
jgi:REP element-mobilizing transposase RayT